MAVADRLLLAGHHVWGYDPDQVRELLLQKKNGTPSDPASLWTRDVLISAVFDTGQLADVIDTAPSGSGKVLVTMSTCDPDQIIRLADRANRKSITLVEAPISGTSKQVQEGTALLLLAGDARGLDVFEDVAVALSPNRQRVGEIGAGNKTKLAINCILGINRAAVAEGLVFAKALGLDPETFLETALRSAARSDVMNSKGPAMVR